MSKVKPGYYAVARGRNIGVYETWAECEAETRRFTGAKYKKFHDKDEAYAWATGSASVANNRTTPSTAFPARVNSVPATSERPGWDVVYSDGACKGNGKTGSVAGIGVWWGDQDPRNIKERCPGAQTNNRAELIAIARVLETAPKITKPLLIKTDSQYSMNCFKQWIHNWKNRNWKNSKGEAVKNAELIRYIDALLGERAMGRQKVEMEYVQGHVGIPGNEGADGLANEGCLYPEEPDRDWVALEAEVFRRIESFGLADGNTSAVAQGANSAGSSHVDNVPDSTSAPQVVANAPSTSTAIVAPTAMASPTRLALIEQAVRERDIPIVSPTKPTGEKRGFKPAHALMAGAGLNRGMSSMAAVMDTTDNPFSPRREPIPLTEYNENNDTRQSTPPLENLDRTIPGNRRLTGKTMPKDQFNTPTKTRPAYVSSPSSGTAHKQGSPISAPDFGETNISSVKRSSRSTKQSRPAPYHKPIYKDMGVNTLPGTWIPADPMSANSEVVQTAQPPQASSSSRSRVPTQKVASVNKLPSGYSQGRIPEDELNAYAECLLDDAELAMEVESDS